MEHIRITNGLVEVIDERVQRRVRLEDFLPNLVRQSPVTLPTIARSQVFAHFDPTDPNIKKLYALTEIPAGIKNITKEFRRYRSGTYRYRLGMPWTYLWFGATTSDTSLRQWTFGEYRIFHSRERWSGPDSPMIVARLPNVYGDGRICWGATGVDPNMSIADRLDQLTNEWYLSRFNDDLDRENTHPDNAGNLGPWVRATAENPNSWRNWSDWNTARQYTVRDLLAEDGITRFTESILLPDSIPAVPANYTFGRLEEWFNTEWTPQQRAMARIALENLRNDAPDNDEVETWNEDVQTVEEDDGGTPV